MRWLHIALIITMAALMTGCATTKCSINADAAVENLPVRTLKAVIFIDTAEPDPDLKKLLKESFANFYEQTGIRFVVQDWKTIRWHASSRSALLQQLAEEMIDYDEIYDIVIGFYDMKPMERLGFNLRGGWTGAIDDIYRKFIVIRRDNMHVLVHELGHTFLFEHIHTGGVMSAYQLCPIGDHLCTKSSVCFLESDRKMILHNKWRDFNSKPELKEKQDLDHGYAYAKTFLSAFSETAIAFIKKLFTPAPVNQAQLIP